MTRLAQRGAKPKVRPGSTAGLRAALCFFTLRGSSGMSATSNVRKRASETPPDDNHTARHLGFMTDRLLKTFNVEAECDCTFICDGERVHASRLVLSAASDYFAALLSGAFKEGGLEPINMPGVSNATLVLCLRYLYTGDGSELTTSNVVDVLYAADMYRIKELCEACCQTMRTTLSPSNGIAYLTAADAVPAGSDLADACLNFVADCLVGATAEGVHALEALSLGTMLKLCSALGVKLKGCAAPAIFFAAFMPALLQWAQAKLGCRPVFSDLCKRADALRHDEMVAAGAHVFSSEHTFVVTQGQLSATTTLSTASRRFEVDCFTLAQVLATNDRNAGSFGLYATAVARQKHPDWWPCILNWRAKCAGRKWHGLCAHMFFSMEHFYRRYGYGSSKFGKHSDLSSPPLGAGELEASDVRAELTTTMDFTSNSLASMCYAYAAFTPAAWGGCSDKKCLEGVLALNCLPVETEDAVSPQHARTTSLRALSSLSLLRFSPPSLSPFIPLPLPFLPLPLPLALATGARESRRVLRTGRPCVPVSSK